MVIDEVEVVEGEPERIIGRRPRNSSLQDLVSIAKRASESGSGSGDDQK